MKSTYTHIAEKSEYNGIHARRVSQNPRLDGVRETCNKTVRTEYLERQWPRCPPGPLY
jgi:hypothetical protein